MNFDLSKTAFKRNRRNIQEFFAILVVMIVPTIVAFSKIGFNSTNIKIPLTFENDEILYATNVLSFLNGTPLQNFNFAAPIGQDLNFAFVSVDSGPILIAAILGYLGGNPFLGLNLFYLLTFGLSGLSGYIAARLLKSNYILSVAAGLIIALPPFHYLWWTGGITVSSYFFLPILFVLTILRIQNLLTKPLFFMGIAISALNGAWYSYYALGYVFLFGTFSIIALIAGFNRTKVIRILPFLGANILAFALVSLPALLAKSRSVGTDYFGDRDAWGAIVSSTTLVHYILPYPGSLEDKFVSLFTNGDPRKSSVHFQSLLNQSGLFGEGWTGALPWGLLLVTAILNFRFIKFKTFSEFSEKNSKKNSEILTIIRSLTIIAILWTLVGGFGTIFSIAISPILRGYARFSIFVIILMAIFCAVGLSGKRFHLQRENLFKRIPSGAIVLVFILTPVGMLMNRSPITAGTATAKVDSTLYVESKLGAPKGCSILQLPIMHYPYEAPGYPTYRLLRFGLISDGYKWSSGAIGGSPAFLAIKPLKELQSNNLSRMVPLAKKLGYCGILIDNEAWDAVANFKPWPEYDSGVIDLVTFLDEKNQNISKDIIDSVDGGYIWINLKNNPTDG
jgi:phosphoglycerol transferase